MSTSKKTESTVGTWFTTNDTAPFAAKVQVALFVLWQSAVNIT